MTAALDPLVVDDLDALTSVTSFPTPRAMPARETVRVEVRRPRSCESCERAPIAQADRAHSLVTFHTATGGPAGGTTVWSPIRRWLDQRAALGWTVLGFDEDTGEATLAHRDGRTAHVAPRSR